MRAILAATLLFFVQSRIRVWCAVIGATVLFGCFEFAVSRWLLEFHIAPDLHSDLQAAVVGLGAGFSLWLFLLGVIDRRRIVADEVRRVAELNHSVRNSLELIVLAHYSELDHEHKRMVLECTDRIDQKLRELFPSITQPGTPMRIAGRNREITESKSSDGTRADP